MKNIEFIFLFIFILNINAFSQKDSLIIRNHYINSIPQNANVFINDTLTGMTPFRCIDCLKAGDKIEITAKGFLEELFVIQSDTELINKTFVLKSLKGSNKFDNNLVFKNKNINFNKKRKLVPIIISGLAAIVSAYLSFDFKSKANDYYDDYQQTGDMSLYDKTKKYDLYSGISLCTFQVSLGFFVYYLLVE